MSDSRKHCMITMTYILNDMAMITDEEEGTCLKHVDLHPNQTIRMPGQVVESDALTKVQALIRKGFPVPIARLDHRKIQ